MITVTLGFFGVDTYTARLVRVVLGVRWRVDIILVSVQCEV